MELVATCEWREPLDILSTSFNAMAQVINLQDFRSLKQAHVWFFNGEDPEGNYAVLKSLLKEEPEMALAWRLLGETCLNLDLPKEALSCLFKAITLEPDSGEACGLAAFALFALNKPNWAAGLLKQAFKCSDESMEDLKLPFFELAIDLAYGQKADFRLKNLWRKAKKELNKDDFDTLSLQLDYALPPKPYQKPRQGHAQLKLCLK
jgi:tetratricopeptide (TPR) repeat protein